MRRTSTLFSICGLALFANAQLAPQQTAPLAAHLTEVNAEWNAHIAAMPDADRPVSFTNDTERIALHLHLVQRTLTQAPHSHLPPGQRTKRTALLSTLEEYADRGLFPQNHVLPYRNPVFIDPYNTACAVGHLMIESGAVDLAHRIDAEMETAYIREMHWPEIARWATEHGFTGDELAWIQPGYSPTIPWVSLGGGTDGEISVLLPLEDGRLLVAGQFTEAGDDLRDGVALWNGTVFEPLGALPAGTLNAAIEYDDEILIGGTFDGNAGDLLRWNGSTWTTSTVFSGKTSAVTAFHIHNGTLYAAGSRSGFAGEEHLVARLVGDVWETVGQSLDATIHTLETLNGTLVCGGRFTTNFLGTEPLIAHVAHLNGNTWQQIGNGLDGTVRDLLVKDGQLYATGDMTSMMGNSFGLARIADPLEDWEPLMPNITDYITVAPFDAPSYANAMVEKDGKIYIAGQIFSYAGLTYGTGVVVFNGTADEVEPYCDFQGPAHAIALLGNRLVVGGVSVLYGNLAATDLTTGIAPRSQHLTITVAPNPVVNEVTVQLPTAIDPAARVRILDAAGRMVAIPVRRAADRLQFSLTALAAGHYRVEVSDAHTRATGAFVKE